MQNFREHVGRFLHVGGNKRQKWNMLIGILNDFKTESIRVMQEKCPQFYWDKKHMLLIRDQESHEAMFSDLFPTIVCIDVCACFVCVCVVVWFVCLSDCSGKRFDRTRFSQHVPK